MIMLGCLCKICKSPRDRTNLEWKFFLEQNFSGMTLNPFKWDLPIQREYIYIPCPPWTVDPSWTVG